MRPRKRRRLPVVLSHARVADVLREMAGTRRLVAELLYGSDLRLLEALQLREKDLDLERHEITVRRGRAVTTAWQFSPPRSARISGVSSSVCAHPA